VWKNESAMNEQGNYALITGATSGIGYELARLFAKDQYNLVIVARHKVELENTANALIQEFGIEAIPISKDLFDPEAPFQLYDELNERKIRIDVLVNDAAQGQF